MLLSLLYLAVEPAPLGAGDHDRGLGRVLGVAERDVRAEVEGYLNAVVAGS